MEPLYNELIPIVLIILYIVWASCFGKDAGKKCNFFSKNNDLDERT
jgi:hypothetical protein